MYSASHRLKSPTAVQVNATAVRVSWTAPSSGPTPSGYRIYYQAEGDQTFTTVDTGQEDTEYLLTDFRPGATYNIRMVTLSQYLPSEFQTLEPITLGESNKPCVCFLLLLCFIHHSVIGQNKACICLLHMYKCIAAPGSTKAIVCTVHHRSKCRHSVCNLHA